MDPSTDLDLQASPLKPSLRESLEARTRHAVRAGVLWAHRQADRFDLIPSDFGKETEVDPADAGSLAREWGRQLKLWMAYNPEEMLAIKAGAVALGVALIVLVVIVGAVS